MSMIVITTVLELAENIWFQIWEKERQPKQINLLAKHQITALTKLTCQRKKDKKKIEKEYKKISRKWTRKGKKHKKKSDSHLAMQKSKLLNNLKN